MIGRKNSHRLIEIEARCLFKNGDNSEVIEKMKQLCSEVSFTHIEFTSQESLGVLFEMVDDLSNLDCLVLGSLEGIDVQISSRDTMIHQLSFTRRNQITKFKIRSFTKKEELQWFMSLLPRMEYFETGIKLHGFDVVTVLKWILSDHLTRVSNLRSICFVDVEINCDVLTQLRQVIEKESLIENYSLRCIRNRIYIQWNRCDRFDT